MAAGEGSWHSLGMRIVLSRKGFDTSPQGGGGASPIVNGRPVSLPIPASGGPSVTTYRDLGLGALVEAASGGRQGPDSKCHHDPMFLADGTVLLGQCGSAQTHLSRQGVATGDLFLFFGLFRDGRDPPHHRIFGYLEVERVLPLASAAPGEIAALAALGFPHALAMHASNDALYMGRGHKARFAHNELRLTQAAGPPSLWQVPAWLHRIGLSYHARGDRWAVPGRLRSASRGQEFVADVGTDSKAHAWARDIAGLVNEPAKAPHPPGSAH